MISSLVSLPLKFICNHFDLPELQQLRCKFVSDMKNPKESSSNVVKEFGSIGKASHSALLCYDFDPTIRISQVQVVNKLQIGTGCFRKIVIQNKRLLDEALFEFFHVGFERCDHSL